MFISVLYYQGWHESEAVVPLSAMQSEMEEEWLLDVAPYAARILAVLKYTNLPLACLNTTKGKQLQQKFETVSIQTSL